MNYKRNVLVEYTIRGVIKTADSFEISNYDIEFMRSGEGSFCGDNILYDLIQNFTKLDEDGDEQRCACDAISCKVIRNASEDDIDRYGIH